MERWRFDRDSVLILSLFIVYAFVDEHSTIQQQQQLDQRKRLQIDKQRKDAEAEKIVSTSSDSHPHEQ